MKKCLLGMLALVGLATLTGCGDDTPAEGAREDGVTELRIALVANNDDPEAGRASEEFTQAMAEALNVTITEIEGVSHLVGIEAMRSGSLDVMMASPFTYMSGLVAGAEIEFLATLYNPDASHNNTTIITGAGNDHIQTLADLEGETFAFVDTASLSGFLNPMYLFVSMFDLDHTRMMMFEPGYFFSSAIASGSHDGSLMAAVNGDVTAAAVGSMIIDNMVESGVVNEDDFRIIYALEPDPLAGYIVRSDLPQTFIDDLRDFLLTFDDEDFFYNIHRSPNARFIETDHSEFADLQRLMDRLEIGQE
ncbi:MAG: phosphate/phosphite/phosphonate ABC transporter substrate-binding protein [Turicibacter sp.]|nr:phosphate/phosphite/phosphonate ABC transporter substrate-binding protein [Turicibacter sp.]